MKPIQGTAFTQSFRKPPIWWFVKLIFPAANWENTIVTFGARTYCATKLQPPLVAHEAVHQRQQKNTLRAIVWWIRYALSPRFRFFEELPAHRAEWLQVQLDERDRYRRMQYFRAIVERLSGPLYNNVCSRNMADRLIMEPSMKVTWEMVKYSV